MVRSITEPTGGFGVDVAGSVALVTGGNRGFGASLCAALVERGAAKVYAGARDVSTVTTPGVEAIPLDITSPVDVETAVARCSDVTLLINNAGIGTGTGVLADDAMEQLQRELDTNVLGPLAMSRAFVPVLAANGGGAIVNVLSVLSWLAAPPSALYCAAKAASWSLTNSLRLELVAQHTQVVAVHVGYMDTDMTARLNVPKSSPDDVARLVLDAVQAGQSEVLADEVSRRVKAALSGDLERLYPALAS
jgi:NAD(P)-dependent dehydrogenase (short-subunit alcohol dehydrogenase family)